MLKSKYKNLVIIGNGFDRWQNLPTSYDEFRKYYAAHIDEAMDTYGEKHRSGIFGRKNSPGFFKPGLDTSPYEQRKQS